MGNRFAAIAVVILGCGHDTATPGGSDDIPDGSDGIPDGSVTQGECPNGHVDKIKFPQSESCANDGSVEFCIPDSDPQLPNMLAAISPAITCGPGGGRAGCTRPPGLLLCSYPTAFPNQCLSHNGEMTAQTWSDMCAIAALPQVTAIVATFYE